MNLKPYKSYKDSNINWIGEIPEHWDVAFLKRFVYSISSGKTKNIDENGRYPLYGSTGIIGSTNNLDYNGIFVLIARVGANAGKTHIAKGKMGITDNTLIVNYIPIINYKFLFYMLSNYDFKTLTIGSGQPLITGNDVKNIKFCIPNLNEQKQIANYLDNKIAKIDETIAKNEELIQLLEEKRIALINQAVTKGLNPDVPMKDSGIEWIGEIPKQYIVTKLKFLTSKIGSGKTPKGGSEIYVSEGIPLLRSQNIHFDSIRLDDVVFITNEINQDMISTVVKNHDVLLNITGASIGRCNYIDNIDTANVNQHVCIVRPNEKIFYKYLNYFLQSECGQNQVFSNQNGTSREGLNFEELSNFYIILPKDINEQKRLALYLENEINKIYSTINKIEENIHLLEEYKTSLIHHVVTGKIDVRGEEI